jgi:hypothetical protein
MAPVNHRTGRSSEEAFPTSAVSVLLMNGHGARRGRRRRREAVMAKKSKKSKKDKKNKKKK